MKRIICTALTAALLTTGASAYRVPNTNTQMNLITFQDANCDPQAQAEMLKKLGLFMGTDKGFELDREMTRAEAAAMLCRFLGGGAEAAKGGFSHPFRDVPAWADASVGWLYQKKLTYGVSDTRYGANQPVTSDQYAAFLSRALCGNDELKGNMIDETETLNIQQSGFHRSHAVAMSLRALMELDVRENRTLAQSLADKGVFTAEEFIAAAWDVVPPEFSEVKGEASLAGIPYAQCSLKELHSAQDSLKADLPYFYAFRTENGQDTLYRVDWKTLEVTLLDQRTTLGTGMLMNYLGEVGGRDYLLLSSYGNESGRLFSVSGNTARLELSETDIGNMIPEQQSTSAGMFAIRTEKGIAVIDESGVRIQEPSQAGETDEESKVLYTGKTSYVMQTVTAEGTTIASVDQASGKVLQSYTVARDIDDRILEHMGTVFGPVLLYGEAGLYWYDPAKGTLLQKLDIAMHDMAAIDRYGYAAVCLVHEPGKRVYGENSLGGDTLIRLVLDSGDKSTLIDASAGIEIAGITSASEGGAETVFYSASDVGMQHFDRYTYSYDDITKKITVRDFEAGRPEVMNGFDYDNPTAYKKAYIAAEQARIDETWNNQH